MPKSQQDLFTLDGQSSVYPVCVKNTFIDIDPGRPVSLDGFYEERRILSCPTSYVEEPESESSTIDTAERHPSKFVSGLPSWCRPIGKGQGKQTDVKAESTAQAVPTNLPSVGSAGHSTGECKPCVFLHVRGCKSGPDCTFCHLCEAGEKKRRQKEKRTFFAQVRQQLQRSSNGAA
mmetsp:Transcript_73179/g.152746  ORF Transcript_73179/g.152746 Transcript_73179/m.152746 type:complete len:176 (+) Transcript_73179:160-687(+)|eukprot:CAMPEP_0206473052 /NCGR_PEP_ID=MMETSP0324_2-20121206/32605_1 /ASSEMBLY_ACC=CAM_ASM_000836 /TAXON_ID=2866 /ORGANISM="Crypthecodinium cohnii, Strain Seligo" /LENGTH=175 /DNA_ID=CAMNT_0053947847 /DNA_START=126 /DNA_END=653 /DNA_ORIENTATION=+